METRELFWSLDGARILLFYVVGTAAIAIFLYGCWRHYAKYRRGASLTVEFDLWQGVKTMLVSVFTHRTVRKRDLIAGYAHAGIFFGFLIAFIGTSIIFIDYDIFKPIFGFSFWKGNFYLWFSLFLDLGHLALTAGLLVMILRRATWSLPKLNYMRSYRGETELRPKARAWQVEDWVFLLTLLVLEITGFLLEGVRLLSEPVDWAIWSPIGLAVAKFLSVLGVSPETATVIRSYNWWFHGILALAFTAAIPWYKAKHIIAVLGSLALRDPKALRRLPNVPEESDTDDEGSDKIGYADISDFTWKDMLNLDACTKCGRCHDVCPARTTGYPLSPRDLVLDLRTHNDETQGCASETIDLVGDVLDADTIWSCRSCGACQDICPVGVEHPAMIVQMRRHLVDQGEMDPNLKSTLDTIADVGNSMGEPARKRSAWTNELEFKVKDIREEKADILWFVGDYASFDPRNQKVSQAVARLLKAGGIDFALLHEGERSAGNDVRRVGEEGLFESLVEHNLAEMAASNPFARIITTDPHSYNTIKNEYPEFGDVAPINHYTELLADMLRDGQLKVKKPLNKRVTFHDPCHLGRINDGYEAPRAILEAIGCEVVEMPRNRSNSFCCGAGGGRIWIPDEPGAEKPSENRMHEAAELPDIEYFITCCPKDLTMFEDARKTSGHEKDLSVKDLAELVAEAIELDEISLVDLPPLAERLTDAVAERIADVISARLETALTNNLASLAVVQPALPPVTVPPSEPDTPATDAVSTLKAVAADPTSQAPSEVVAEKTQVVESAAPIAIQPEVALQPMDWDNLAPLAPAQLLDYDVPEKDGLRILVAIKHVAVLGDEHEFTADGCDIQAEFLEHELNEWDDAALEEALQLVEKAGSGEVVAVCIGPESADASLRKVLAKGASRAVRLWNDGLISADPLMIARGIAGVATKEQPDFILTGVQSSDHAHGATGAALSRILDLPHAAVVVALNWTQDGAIEVVRELEGGVRHSLSLPVPALLSIQTGGNTPRYATMRMIKKAKKLPIEVLDAESMLEGGGGYSVRRMYTPEQENAQMLDGSPQDIASFVANIIREKRGT